jgi:hypothetical protein
MNREKCLETVLVITIGFLVIYWLSGLIIFFYISIFAGLLGLISTRMAILISRGWFWLGAILGGFMSRILLTLVFGLITLQSMIYRLVKGKRPLDHTPSDSYYHIRDHEYSPSDMEEQW